MEVSAQYPCLKWAVAAPLLLILGQFAIILAPSPATLLLFLVLLLTIALFFIALFRQWRKRRGTTLVTLLKALLFLGVFSSVLHLSQQHLIFGYKAVNNRLSPDLVSGDHYLGDKFLYRRTGLQKGSIYVVRRGEKRGIPARLLSLPGEPFLPQREGALGEGEYGFDLGGEQVVITTEQILARALINYHTFAPDSEKVIWERMGRVIP